jgi:methylmalonyl-CoA/ethylmalonyl-CoA epimerase
VAEKNLVSHIGIAVSDLEQAIKVYATLLNGSEPEIHEVEDQQVRVAIFSGDNQSGRIELVSATSDESPIARFISKKGEGLHHICLYVDDIEAKLAELKKSGVRLIDETPRTGAEGGKIAFVHPASCNGVLIELEERRN